MNTISRLSLIGCACLGLAGCGLPITSRSDGDNKEALNVSVFLCKLESQNLQDLSGDGRVSPGDRLTMVISVSTQQNCATDDGSLYVSRELVSVDEERESRTRFLTLNESTLQLTGQGRLQAKGMHTITVPRGMIEKIRPQSRQALHTFELLEIFQSKAISTVQGFDGEFAGMVGTESITPGNPPELSYSLKPLTR